MSEQSLQQPEENDWVIDPAVNDGFPFACDAVPDAFNAENMKSIWDFSADGFPASANILSLDFSKVKSVWKIHASVNDGFPYIQGVFEIVPVPSGYPRFTEFSVSGLGASFKTVSENTALSLPEEMHFRFQKSDALSFRFPENQPLKF